MPNIAVLQQSHRLQLLTVILAMGATVATPSSCQMPQELAVNKSLVDSVRALAPKLLRSLNITGVAIAVIRNGQVAWTGGFGLADADAGRPVTVETVFNVGSISKTVSAWGAMRLVDEGKLELDRPIDSYLTRWHLPSSAYSHSAVTLRRLLSHTAGLSPRGYLGLNRGQAVPSLVQSLSGEPDSATRVRIEIEPGTKWQYSGGGYAVVQLVIEEVTQQRFADYMRSAVLAPLGMDHSEFGWSSEMEKLAAIPYDALGWPVYGKSTSGAPRFAETAAAGLQTTIEDIARFAAASVSGASESVRGRVLKQATLSMMQSPVAPAANWGVGYELITDSSGIALIGHGGWNRGWQASLRLAPKEGAGLVILTNTSFAYPFIAGLVCAWERWIGSQGEAPYCRKLGVSWFLYKPYREGGSDRVVARYRRLREIASDQYDFGEAEIVFVAGHVLAAKRPADAIRLLQFNLEQFPSSSATYSALGDAHLAKGDTASAVTHYRRSLELNPQNEESRRKLAQLRR